MSATTTRQPRVTHRGRPTAPTARPAPATTRPASDDASRGMHEPDDLHDLARLLAAPVSDAAQRERVDRALELLLGPDGADAGHLRPTRHTSDVVRHRIAAKAMSRLSSRDSTHQHLIAGALAILRR